MSDELRRDGTPETAPGDHADWTFISLYNVAESLRTMGRGFDEVIAAYERASRSTPNRAEALHGASRLCRQSNRFAEGYEYARRGLIIQRPTGSHCVVSWIYDYGLLDEFAVNAYWVGRYAECLEACERLLGEGRFPIAQRARIETNAGLARERCGPGVSSGERKPTSGAIQVGVPSTASTLAERSEQAHERVGRFTVLVMHSRTRPHSHAIDELSETVLYGLLRLGFDARITQFPSEIEGRAVIVGPHLLSSRDATRLPDDVILYNTEHMSRITTALPGYLELLRSHEVWDYSRDNADRLSVALGRPAKYVPIGFVPELVRIEKKSIEDIDVLFYGSSNPRRDAILDGLRAVGLNVHQAFGVYGTDRDKLISRAKVVLNLHFYEPGAFEAVRVSYLLANGKAVVTEVNQGEFMDPDLTGAVVSVPYEHLITACKAIVTDSPNRQQLEERAFLTFSAREEGQILRTALGTPSSFLVLDAEKWRRSEDDGRQA